MNKVVLRPEESVSFDEIESLADELYSNAMSKGLGSAVIRDPEYRASTLLRHFVRQERQKSE